jgi:hypothetical protein
MAPMDIDHEFPYRQRWLALPGFAVLFGGLAAGSLVLAIAGEHALWFGFGIFGTAFVGCALVLRNRDRGARPRIAFTATGVRFPRVGGKPTRRSSRTVRSRISSSCGWWVWLAGR